MNDVHDELVAALAGRYEIERELGHGGMATVYLARDVRHDRHVAVKVLHPELTMSLGAERFVREVNIAARLSHPHILALYDSGATGSVLYYVMPHVAGETLRQRLKREYQLPLDEALAVTKQIASALDYAHEQGVVHRDIKPENILLLGDHVLVADFGLARAVYSAASPRLTGSAVVVGTAAYMSPEQAAADEQVDGRTDLYSLACVLFEMVTGLTPFRGPTIQALMSHHLLDPPPSMCSQRKACPPWVDAAVQRALEKNPADRFRTAAQFIRALEEEPAGSDWKPGQGSGASRARATSRARRWQYAAATVAATVLVGAIVVGWLTTRAANAAAALSDSRYLIAPFEHRGAVEPALALAVTQRVSDAVSEWRGVSPVAATVALPVPSDQRQRGVADVGEGMAAAASKGARWLVWGDVVSDADSVTVHASLYDVRRRERLRGTNLRHASAGVAPRALYRKLVNGLLRSRDELPWNGPSDEWAASLPAWTAYDRGREAIARWDLDAAERDMRQAARTDPRLAQAHLWLAKIGIWQLHPIEQWTASARRAHALRSRLASGDVALAEAQVHLGEGRFPEACTAYRNVIRHDSTDVSGWVGLGDCQVRDSIVEPVSPSRSGYRFRSSYHAASRGYIRARERMHAPAPTFIYHRLGRVLYTDANRFRPGRLGRANAIGFSAFPALDSDTIAFTPYPFEMMTSARREASPLTQVDALERNRRRLRTLYLEWVAEVPASVEAHESLAALLEKTEELVGAGRQPSALGEIAAARSLAGPTERRPDFGRTQLRLLVKTGRWADAKALADSIFALWPGIGAGAADILVGAAALTGRLERTAALLGASSPELRARIAAVESAQLPPSVQNEIMEILPEFALGVCSPRVVSFPRRLEQRLESYYPDPARLREVRDAILLRVMILAAPCGQGIGLRNTEDAGDPWFRMHLALGKGDRAGVRREFDQLQKARRGIRPGYAAVDVTYIEAWLLSAAGDTAMAIAHLDRTLGALPTLGTFLLDFPTQSAGLVRAMGLRAELAEREGDRVTARYWAGAVVTLWRDADEPLRPFVERMKRLSRAD